MFGLIIAGRPAQSDCQQIDETHFIFNIAQADQVNHLTIFLTQPFPQSNTFAATVHFMWPSSDGTASSGWRLLGMLSNDKPSATFRLHQQQQSAQLKPSNTSQWTTTGSPLAPTIAQLGICIEPLEMALAEMRALEEHRQQQQQSRPSSAGNVNGAMIIKTSSSAMSTDQLAASGGAGGGSTVVNRVVENLYNYVMSFVGPTDAQGVQYIPLKVFQDWYDGVQRKLVHNPQLFQ